MESDEVCMRAAITAGDAVRTSTAPNPWVGAALVDPDGNLWTGATQPPGGPHAEIAALTAARSGAAEVRGATVYTTLEPCVHHGRTAPCTAALIDAGIARVVVAVEDPDPVVSGKGMTALREAGITVDVGVLADDVERQLAAYLHHRRTGRPYVVLKLAATLDGRTAAADGSSQWITGVDARRDAHRLRAESQAIVVGAGTVRADDPSLTTRLVEGPDPLRVVLGHADPDARVQPCLEWPPYRGDLAGLLSHLGGKDVLQVLVEGGATVAHSFHRAGLVDRYVVYIAPALAGGDDAPGLFRGGGAPSIDDVWRGRIDVAVPLGDDLRIELVSRSGGRRAYADGGPIEENVR